MKASLGLLVDSKDDEEIPVGVKIIHAPEAWQYSQGAGARLFLFDTGVDTSHEDLRISDSQSFCSDEHDPLDHNGHGTETAGIICAPKNGRGIIGVAPEVSLISLKVLNSGGSGTIDDIKTAIAWCLKQVQESDVLCLNFGTVREPDPQFQDAVLALANSGAIVVTGPAAERNGSSIFPGNCKGVISVAPIDRHRTYVGDVSCWDGFMKTTKLGGGYVRDILPDWPTVLVAGTAALVKGIRPHMNVDDLRKLLQSTSESFPDIEPVKQVNAFLAIKKALTQ